MYNVDLNDLQNFVNVSLATAAGGEDDLTRDKLSNLLTVGRGFGPLIYRLPSNASYQTLQEYCQPLWDTLKDAPKLFDLLVSWLKSYLFHGCMLVIVHEYDLLLTGSFYLLNLVPQSLLRIY